MPRTPHHDDPQDAPKHRAIITSDEPISVHVGDPNAGRWFRVFHALVESGTWAELLPVSKAVYVVLAKHANQQWAAWPSVGTLIRLAGIQRAGAYKAIDELERRGLIRRTTRGGGGKTTMYQLMDPTPRPVHKRGPVHRHGRVRGPQAWTDPSTGVDPNKTNELEGNNSSVAVVAVLLAQGFARKDAERIAATPEATPEQVRTAIANADRLDAAGKLANRRGYIRTAVAEGYPLDDAAAKQQARQEAADRRREREHHAQVEQAAEREQGRRQERETADALDALDDDALAELVRAVADEQDTRTRRRWLAVPEPRKHARLRAAIAERISGE